MLLLAFIAAIVPRYWTDDSATFVITSLTPSIVMSAALCLRRTKYSSLSFCVQTYYCKYWCSFQVLCSLVDLCVQDIVNDCVVELWFMKISFNVDV